MLERPAKSHGRIELLKLRLQLLVDKQQRSKRTVQVAIAASHDPVNGGLTRSGTHRNTLWLSPESISGARPAFLWIAWKGPNDDSLVARAHHFATLQLTINIKLLMTAI